MAGYNLQPGECFVHSQVRVVKGGGYLDELILTSCNLVLLKTVRKGMFGSEQATQILPLNQVKVFQGRAQALVGGQQNGSALDVYFQNGVEHFRFQGKKEALFWSQKINEVITGVPAQMTSPNPSAAEQATEVLKDTVGVFKDVLGLSSRTQAAAPTAAVPIARDCTSCGAPLAGMRGQAVICSYCDTPTQL